MPRRTARTSAAKHPVNLSVRAELLREARGRDINLSSILERALEEELCRRRRERWLAENKSGIEAYNDHVDQHGAFADTLRSL